MSNFIVSGLNTVIVQVRNLEKSIQFYENVLKLKKGYVDESMAYFSFDSKENETTILLHIVDEPEPVEKGIVIELMVNGLDSAISYIKEAGGQIAQEPIVQDWGVTEAIVVDPDGYKIYLVEPLK